MGKPHSETQENIQEKVVNFSLKHKVADMPPSALKAVSWLLLDTIGVSAGAIKLEAGQIACDVACELYGASETGVGAHMLFDGRRVSLAGAAYAGATQIDNLDAHDGYSSSKGHIGVTMVPSLVALAENLPHLSGPEALAALVVGYEVAARAAISLHASVPDYHASGSWNPLGVVAMAARMRGGSPDQLRRALGIAEYHGTRSQMMREIDNPSMLHDASGWGAMVGVSAIVLAEKDFQAGGAITVEGDEVRQYWEDLGVNWTVEQQYLKPYPVCRWAHAAIDGAQKLCNEHAIQAADIEAIEVHTFAEGVRLNQSMPKATYIAQYSLPSNVAAMIAYGRVGVEHVSGAGLSDKVVEDLVRRTTVKERKRHSERFPAGRWADVKITLRDGTVYDSGDINARGGPDAVFSDQEILDKFMEYAVPNLGEERARKIAAATQALTSPDSLFSDFVALVLDPA